MPKITPRTPDILAIDPSTHCGWAHSDGSSGVIHLPERKKGESNGKRFDFFSEWLKGHLDEHRTRFLVYEVGGYGGWGAPMEINLGVRTLMVMIAYLRNIQHVELNSSSIKKYATGKGNAKKEDMIRAALAKHPTVDWFYDRKGQPDDNQVDAIWMLDLALREVQW